MKTLVATVACVLATIAATLHAQNLDANYYRQKAAECRAKAAEYNRLADSLQSSRLPTLNLGGSGGGGGPSMSGQYRQAAQAYLNAAAQYDAKALQTGSSGTGFGTAGGFGTTPGFSGGNSKAQQLQQFQNSLVGIANAFQAMEDRKAQREAARRENEREQAEADRLRAEENRRQARQDELERLLQEQEDRLERQRQEFAQLEASRARFGSLSSMQGGTEAPIGNDPGGLASLMMDSTPTPGSRPGPPPVGNHEDWLVGQAQLAVGNSPAPPGARAEDVDWLVGSARAAAPAPTSPAAPAPSLIDQLKHLRTEASGFYQENLQPIGRSIADSVVEDVLHGRDIDFTGAAEGAVKDSVKDRVVEWAKRKFYDPIPEDQRNDAEARLALAKFSLKALAFDLKGAHEAYSTFQDTSLAPVFKELRGQE